jgi:hypothetical protein
MEGQQQTLKTGFPFEFRGKVHHIEKWDFNLENDFAAWVVARSKARIRADRRQDGEEEYQARMDGLRRDVDAGLYEWGMPIVVRAWRSPEGSIHIVWLTLLRQDKEVKKSDVTALARDDREKWDELWEDLIALNFPLPAAPEDGETPDQEAPGKETPAPPSSPPSPNTSSSSSNGGKRGRSRTSED